MPLDFIQACDNSILLWIQENMRTPFWDKFFATVTTFGNKGFIWLLLAAFLFAFKKTRKQSFMIIIGILLVYILGDHILKPLLERPRPFREFPLFPLAELLIEPPGMYSFPSGHTSSSFVAAAVLFRYKKKWGLIALIPAILIAFSRLYLYVHYPSDVLVGILLGVGISFAAEPLADYALRVLKKITGRI